MNGHYPGVLLANSVFDLQDKLRFKSLAAVITRFGTLNLFIRAKDAPLFNKFPQFILVILVFIGCAFNALIYLKVF